jgi:hypothetical protein
VLTGEERQISEADIWIGINTEITSNHFYHGPLHSNNFYVEECIGNDLTYVLLESYQHGKLFQARIKQTLTGRTRVVEISDAAEIARLTRMYEHYKRN